MSPRISKACSFVTKRPLILSRFSATCFRQVYINFDVNALFHFFCQYLITRFKRSSSVSGPMYLIECFFSSESVCILNASCYSSILLLLLLDIESPSLSSSSDISNYSIRRINYDFWCIALGRSGNGLVELVPVTLREWKSFLMHLERPERDEKEELLRTSFYFLPIFRKVALCSVLYFVLV